MKHKINEKRLNLIPNMEREKLRIMQERSGRFDKILIAQTKNTCGTQKRKARKDPQSSDNN